MSRTRAGVKNASYNKKKKVFFSEISSYIWLNVVLSPFLHKKDSESKFGFVKESQVEKYQLVICAYSPVKTN